MKKIFSITLIVATCLLFASSAMASGSPDGSSIGGTVFKTSSNVVMVANSTTVAYGVASKHVNGDKGYASSDTSSEITPTDAAKGTVATAVTIEGVGTYAAL